MFRDHTRLYGVGRHVQIVPMLQSRQVVVKRHNISIDRLQRVACLVGGRAAGLQLTSPKDALCGQQWKAVPEVKCHLTTKL